MSRKLLQRLLIDEHLVLFKGFLLSNKISKHSPYSKINNFRGLLPLVPVLSEPVKYLEHIVNDA